MAIVKKVAVSSDDIPETPKNSNRWDSESSYIPPPELEIPNGIDKLAKALVQFRSECPNAGKDKQGYNYRYTTLAYLIDMVRPLLKKHGLSVIQTPITDSRGIGTVTLLLHESGQYIKSRFVMPLPKLSGTNITQDAGAAISYARRYALSAVLGLASDEDTDATFSDESESTASKKTFKRK